ncbi:MAG: D-alanyl-D-alanine carboxypeptidase family protein, partial [Candidatus Puniceispirillaceae bacterium]
MTKNSLVRAFLAVLLVTGLGAIASAAIAAEITSPAKQVYVTDFETGKVLFSKEAETPMKPASMAKIMTVFVAFQRIADGQLRMDDKLTVSEKAWKKGGSRTFLEVGSQVSVRELLHGIIVQSGNDAAIVLAEGISGT